MGKASGLCPCAGRAFPSPPTAIRSAGFAVEMEDGIESGRISSQSVLPKRPGDFKASKALESGKSKGLKIFPFYGLTFCGVPHRGRAKPFPQPFPILYASVSVRSADWLIPCVFCPSVHVSVRHIAEGARAAQRAARLRHAASHCRGPQADMVDFIWRGEAFDGAAPGCGAASFHHYKMKGKLQNVCNEQKSSKYECRCWIDFTN